PAQHATFEHAQDQRGPTRITVAIPIQILTDKLATHAANCFEDLVDVTRHQVLCPTQRGLERGVTAVDEVAQDVDRPRSFPLGGHFDTGHNLEARRGRGVYRLVQT